MHTRSNFLEPPPPCGANIKLDVAKNQLEVKPKFLAPSRPRMNASNMWSEFVKPNYNGNTQVQKNLILNMKMRSENLTSFIFVFSIL